MAAAVALTAAGCGSSSTPPQSATRTAPLISMFEAQPQLLTDPSATLDELQRLGVGTIRVFVPWSALAPDPAGRVAPTGAATPAAYLNAAWARFDGIVSDAAARRIGVDLTLEGPPPLWAAGPGAPPGTPAGGADWEPSPTAYGAFVLAAGTRYSGHYRPPGASAPLPRVSVWSIWNEPNYGPQLAPQATDQSTVEVAPRVYRGLADAAWAALGASGHAHDTILIGELAPRGITVGNSPGNFSGMVPLRFVRALYCVDSSLHSLQGTAAAARGCPTTRAASQGFAAAHPALFEASGVAVHPYPQGAEPPNVQVSGEPDYADLASLPRLERLLDTLAKTYGSSKRFDLYSTEFGYKTNPPFVAGVTPDLAAAYLNWSEYISWRDPRIRSYDQYLLRDPPSTGTSQFVTGLRFADGAAKATYAAFRMPIFLPATRAVRGQTLEVWGCVRPARDAMANSGRRQTVEIELRAPKRAFKVIHRVSSIDSNGYFDAQIRFSSTGIVRLAWSYPHGPTIYSRQVAIAIT